MSNKFLIYTSNLDIMPKDMGDIINFAKSTPKFRISNVELNGSLAKVEAGDNIITKKGNSLYVIKALTESLDNLSEEDQSYVETLTREYGMKKVNITGVEQIIKFSTWCKCAKPLVNNNKKTKEMSNSIKGFGARVKAMFMPTEVDDVRIATDGNLCVKTANGYVAIDANNELTSYPEELTLSLPVYVISKPKDQVVAGDVIALDRSYAKVTEIKGSKISAISYTGSGKSIHTVKDFLFNQSMVRVVISLAGNIGGQLNPMLLLAMSEGDKSDSILPLLMMNQQGGALGANPMLLAMMADEGKTSMKDLLLMSALSGNNNPFGNLFGGTAAPATVSKPRAKARVATKKAVAKKKVEPANDAAVNE